MTVIFVNMWKNVIWYVYKEKEKYFAYEMAIYWQFNDNIWNVWGNPLPNPSSEKSIWYAFELHNYMSKGCSQLIHLKVYIFDTF